MKIIYLQDTHIRGKNPEHRMGNYYADIMTKITEVISLSKKLKVDFVIHGGDCWDSANVSNVMLDEFIDLIEEAKIDWYILPGTHDMIGHDWALSKSSTLAHAFRRSKYIHELTELSIGKKDDCFIQGFKYYHNCEGDIKNEGLMCKNTNAKFKIGVTHSFITMKSFLKTVMHVVAKDIKTDFDILLNAHYHQPWGIKKINGTKFVNIGCFGRKSVDEIAIKPTIVLIDTNTHKIDLIPLKSAKEGAGIFDLTKVQETKAFEQDIDNFIKSLSDVKMQSLDIRGIVEYLAGNNNVDKEVKEEVIKRIGEFE